MTSVDWPLRLIPRRDPPFAQRLAISAVSLFVALSVRAAFLGPTSGLGVAPTFFPALMVVSLYAGPWWGAGVLLVQMALATVAPTPLLSDLSRGFLVLFSLCGALTVLVASVLREALIRLHEAHERERAAQETLARAETRLGLAQDAGGVGLWEWDMATRAGHWSPRLYRNLGIDPSQPARLGAIVEVADPRDRDLVLGNFKQLRDHGVLEEMEYRVIWPDGSIHWLLTRGEMIRDAEGRDTHAVGINIDVTARRRAEEQLRESEQRFRAMADSAPCLMWVSAPDGVREFVNEAYVEFLGRPYDEALTFDWRTRMAADDLETAIGVEREAHAVAGMVVLEARYLRADGEWRWIRSISRPRQGPGGELLGYIGIGFDVTEAKLSEESLKSVNELLAERMEAALAERDQAEAAMRRAQKLEAVGQLTGGVAHDFNNLLTVIVGALDLIQRHPHDESRRERMLEAALGAARRGERLTHQLLAFSRRQNLKPELVKVDDLIGDCEPLLHRAVGEAVAFIVEPGAPVAVALIDPSQFEAAVMNLVVNARDAVTGGGSIRVETSISHLAADQVEEVDAGPYVCIAVHDTGVGMSPEVVARVFEPFFTTKEVGKGTGLGLSQVYGFARQSGGGVAVETAPGKGATVRMYLPLSDEAVALAEESVGDEAANGPALSVLLVEDDLEVGDLVAAMLEDLGHEVLRAADVEEGLQVLRTSVRIDLLLTDLVMPGGRTGVDLARQAVILRAGLPVILSSGYTGDALSPAERAPWPLLRKPYSADALARVIDSVIAEPATAA